jgi:prepilin-type processing-associated H-X9-DG protein
MGYVINCFGWEKDPQADVMWMTSLLAIRSKSDKVYLADNEDGPWRMIITRENDPGFPNLDVVNENHLADGPDGSRRVAQMRHRKGYNGLFLDWHVEYVKVDKQDAREVRRLELRRWKWFGSQSP